MQATHHIFGALYMLLCALNGYEDHDSQALNQHTYIHATNKGIGAMFVCNLGPLNLATYTYCWLLNYA